MSADDPELRVAASDEEPGPASRAVIVAAHGATAMFTRIGIPVPVAVPPVTAFLPPPTPIVIIVP